MGVARVQVVEVGVTHTLVRSTHSPRIRRRRMEDGVRVLNLHMLYQAIGKLERNQQVSTYSSLTLAELLAQPPSLQEHQCLGEGGDC